MKLSKIVVRKTDTDDRQDGVSNNETIKNC